MTETTHPLWNQLIRAVQAEVKPALGCTEPVSLALACAQAAALLPGPATRIKAWVSPNLMKNGMGVTVPGTGMVGLPIAAALGALAGDAQAGLEVLKNASPAGLNRAKALLDNGGVRIRLQAPCEDILYARACVYAGDEWACVTISGGHTRVVQIERQGEICFQLAARQQRISEEPLAVLGQVRLAQLVEFIEQVPLAAIRFILQAASLNDALSREGLTGRWGLHIGATLDRQRARGFIGRDLASDIIIRTAAASDARMGGATLPAMSNSGSGNQGIAATMPVLVVAQQLQVGEEPLARALMLAHLTAIYIHYQLPRLSALCAATTAAMGAAAGMGWLLGGDYQTIAMAVSSMVGDLSGMICDGAANSCAMKVSSSASSAWKAVLMALDNSAVSGHDGIVAADVEQSIANLCALANRSMQETDRQIIEIMAYKAS